MTNTDASSIEAGDRKSKRHFSHPRAASARHIPLMLLGTSRNPLSAPAHLMQINDLRPSTAVGDGVSRSALKDLGVDEARVIEIATGNASGRGAIHTSLNPASQMYGGSGEYWLDLALHCVLMDLAGRYIVGNFTVSSYTPWAEAADSIVDDEKMHIGFGRKEFERCLLEGVPEDLLLQRFTYWYSRSLNFFGPPPGRSAEVLRRYGIKRKGTADQFTHRHA